MNRRRLRLDDYGPAYPIRAVSCAATAALYARVSTTDQTPETQLSALRAYAHARNWPEILEFVDIGVSGIREHRPAFDEMLKLVRARRVDVVVVTKLDRLARSTHHLVTVGREFEVIGVDLVVLDQAMDTTTPSGRLLFHVLAAIAEFERDLIRERVVAGVHRARELGRRLGRPRIHEVDVSRARDLRDQGHSLRAVARALGLHPTTVRRAL
jgi:DNA invertase Pin-like site-specific DNA recombinase